MSETYRDHLFESLRNNRQEFDAYVDAHAEESNKLTAERDALRAENKRLNEILKLAAIADSCINEANEKLDKATEAERDEAIEQVKLARHERDFFAERMNRYREALVKITADKVNSWQSDPELNPYEIAKAAIGEKPE